MTLISRLNSRQVHITHNNEVWFRVLACIGLNVALPQQNSTLERWWTESRKRVRKHDRKRFVSLVFLTVRTLWKQRNNRVFDNVQEQRTPAQVVILIGEEFLLWELAKRGGREIVTRE